jgi:glycosyltransferase involved in cell wall biosynthesis
VAVKVLLVSPYPPCRDGIAMHARHLVQHLQTMHDVEVLTQPDRGSDCGADGDDPRQGPVVHEQLWPAPHHVVRVARSIRRIDPEILHYQFALPALGMAGLIAIVAGRLARGNDRPRIVFTLHEVRRDVRRLGAAGAALYRLIVRWADAVIVYSEEGRDVLADRCAADPQKIVVMPHGVATSSEPQPTSERLAEIDKRYDLAASTLVLSFGYVHPHKGTEHLIDAVAMLRSESPELLHGVVFLIAGAVRPRRGVFRRFERKDHQYQAFLTKKVAEAGLGASVRFVGYVPEGDVDPLFRRAAIAVCPYTDASQSGVLNLAIAAGTPCLVSDLPGLRENLRGGGLLAAPGDAAALAGGLARLLGDAGLRQRLRRGQEEARDEMSFAAVVLRLDSLYRELAGKPEAPLKAPGKKVAR